MTQLKIIEEMMKELDSESEDSRVYQSKRKNIDLEIAKDIINKALTSLRKENDELKAKFVRITCECMELKSQLFEKDKSLFISKSAIATLKIFHKKDKEEMFKEIDEVLDGELLMEIKVGETKRKYGIRLIKVIKQQLKQKHLKQKGD